MSVETLQRAAALARERAKAATPSPWSPTWPDADCYDGPVVTGGPRSIEVVGEWQVDPSDAIHIASWHPAVALAAADWLDKAVADFHAAESEYAEERECGRYPYWTPQVDSGALAFARAYLGETSCTTS